MAWIALAGQPVLKQSHQQSCGYCCVGMIVNLIDPASPKHSEQSLVSTGKRLDPGAYDRAARDRVGALQTPLVMAAYEQHKKIPHWGSGTYGEHLAYVVREYQVDAKYQRGSDVKTAMRAVSVGKPLIVLVQWQAGGGHWVVVESRRTRGIGSASDYTILDPAGHVVVNRGSTTYDPPYSGTGKFANYFVTVKGRLHMPKGVKLPGF